MRRIVLGLLTAIPGALSVSVLPAAAAEYPVCLVGGASDQVRCEFDNVEQCRATASGGIGYCAANPTLGLAFANRGRAIIRIR